MASSRVILTHLYQQIKLQFCGVCGFINVDLFNWWVVASLSELLRRFFLI